MGVSWVFESDRPVKAVERLLEGAGAELTGSYTVDSLPYKLNDQLQQYGHAHIFIFHHSNFPQSSFSIAPADTLKASPRAVCDRGFDLILGKLSAGLQPDRMGKFEVSGNEYQLKDFIVRVGTASMATTTKGVIVEVEYPPSQVASQAIHLLTEFMQMLFPEQAKSRPDVIAKSAPEVYAAIDTLYQYNTVFARMRNKA